jgi:hypothetical protein
MKLKIFINDDVYCQFYFLFILMFAFGPKTIYFDALNAIISSESCDV